MVDGSLSPQKRHWEVYSTAITEQQLERQLLDPSRFQIDMAELIDAHCGEFPHPVVAEIGCETGISLLMTRCPKEKVFVDFDEGMIEKLRAFCGRRRIEARFVVNDMFEMRSLSDESCDVVFNSGVIEHYDREARARAVREYTRVLRPGGYLVIAYPNHYSLIYKFAYVIRRMLGPKFWPWPRELAIRDLRAEFETNGVHYLRTVLRDEITNSLFYGPLGPLIRAISPLLRSERYLRVSIGQKPS